MAKVDTCFSPQNKKFCTVWDCYDPNFVPKIFSYFFQKANIVKIMVNVQKMLNGASSEVVHCCYYISLLPGCRNIVQGGNPLYAAGNNKYDCGGQIWPNWVQFFAKNTWLMYLVREKIILAPKNNFWAAREAFFFRLWSLFRLVFKNWGLIIVFWKLFPELKCPIYW